MRVTISGAAMSTIEGSEIALDPAKYDGGSPGAVSAFNGLTSATRIKRGRGVSYLVEVDRAGAEMIAEYCDMVGVGFMMETDPETRAEGRALIVVRDRINRLLQD